MEITASAGTTDRKDGDSAAPDGHTTPLTIERLTFWKQMVARGINTLLIGHFSWHAENYRVGEIRTIKKRGGLCPKNFYFNGQPDDSIEWYKSTVGTRLPYERFEAYIETLNGAYWTRPPFWPESKKITWLFPFLLPLYALFTLCFYFLIRTSSSQANEDFHVRHMMGVVKSINKEIVQQFPESEVQFHYMSMNSKTADFPSSSQFPTVDTATPADPKTHPYTHEFIWLSLPMSILKAYIPAEPDSQRNPLYDYDSDEEEEKRHVHPLLPGPSTSAPNSSSSSSSSSSTTTTTSSTSHSSQQLHQQLSLNSSFTPSASQPHTFQSWTPQSTASGSGIRHSFDRERDRERERSQLHGIEVSTAGSEQALLSSPSPSHMSTSTSDTPLNTPLHAHSHSGDPRAPKSAFGTAEPLAPLQESPRAADSGERDVLVQVRDAN